VPLRDDIRLLGRILGDTVRKESGETVFGTVEGITSNQMLSQQLAENVMEFLLSQGVKPDLIGAGIWRRESGCFERHSTGPRAEPSCRALSCRFRLLRVPPLPAAESSASTGC
jgi:hypothetical protein